MWLKKQKHSSETSRVQGLDWKCKPKTGQNLSKKVLQDVCRTIPQDFIKNRGKSGSIKAECQEMRGGSWLLFSTVYNHWIRQVSLCVSYRSSCFGVFGDGFVFVVTPFSQSLLITYYANIGLLVVCSFRWIVSSCEICQFFSM